ncbi:MAG: putative bifunctional diguanylate cyclase/phosphodiesterase, partial [Actinomycetota bacterium]
LEDRNNDGLFSCKDGSVLPVAYTTSPVVRDGQLVGAVIAFHDISERKTFEQRLKHQAFHDTLTGLPNRALFMDRLEHAQARMARTGSLYALLFIDLDRFKVVNDSLGHHVGDQLLVQMANRLRKSIRGGDTLARFGGDEFVALLEDLQDEDDGVAITRRILSDMSAPVSVAGRELSVSCSIGVVIGDGSRQDPDECVRAGDVAMYRAKARGKDCYEVFRHDADPAELRRLDLEIELRDALERGELELHYQPVIAAASGAITGIEALLRWRHPVRGFVSPAEFIPLAEETGLILPLGQWVLEEACRQAKAWDEQNAGPAGLLLSVNLSPRQFLDPDLANGISQVLKTTGLEPKALELEITESSVMDRSETSLVVLQQLRGLGVRVVLDDFGTG